MLQLFTYNWQVREEWFEWCSHLPQEVLLATRVGGWGSILATLFHIVDTEYSWIRRLQGRVDVNPLLSEYMSLHKVRKLSGDYHNEVANYIHQWDSSMEGTIVAHGGQRFKYGEVLRHIITHEIHHIGQLSIWAKEVGQPSVSANFIGRGIS